MVAPNLKIATDTFVDETGVMHDVASVNKGHQVIMGTEPGGERIQAHVIENLINNYDVVVYIDGSNIIARHSNGALVSSGTAGTNDTTVIQSALDVNGTTGVTPTVILFKPGLYRTGTPRPTAHSNTTIIGYGGVTWRVITNLASPLQTDNGVQNFSIFGITFDLNQIGAPLVARGDETAGGCKNIIIQDCDFIKPMNPLITGDSNRMLYVTYSFPVSAYATKMNEHIRYINCFFDCDIPNENDPGSFQNQSICQIANCRDVKIERCRFVNHNRRSNAALSIYHANIDVGIINCTFEGGDGDTPDVSITQSAHIRMVGCHSNYRVRITDARHVYITGGNHLKSVHIQDQDNPEHDTGNLSLYRGSQYIFVDGNEFNTDPEQGPASIYIDGTPSWAYAVLIDTDANKDNPPKYIIISNNTARIFNHFVNTQVPPATMTAPVDTLIIQDNKILERTSTSSSGPVIRIKHNTSVPSQGYKNVFIKDNFFPVKTGVSNHNDIQLDGTGFTNVVIKGNWLRAGGITNSASYPNITDNLTLE